MLLNEQESKIKQRRITNQQETNSTIKHDYKLRHIFTLTNIAECLFNLISKKIKKE